MQVEGIPGIPDVYGWCVTNPMASYLSIQPFTTDLFQYLMDNGAMRLRQACEVAGKVVSLSVLPFIRDL